MTLLEAVAAVDALPQLTRDIEDAVHVHGESIRAISRALAISEADVHGHLHSARDARTALQRTPAPEAHAGTVAGKSPVGKGAKVDRLLTVAIEMANRGERLADIAKATGWPKTTVSYQLCQARARGVPVSHLSRLAG